MSDTVALAFIAMVQVITLALVGRVHQRQGHCGSDQCKETFTRISKKPVVEI